jgi:hypothetical protein
MAKLQIIEARHHTQRACLLRSNFRSIGHRRQIYAVCARISAMVAPRHAAMVGICRPRFTALQYLGFMVAGENRNLDPTP